jgi:ComF family protein
MCVEHTSPLAGIYAAGVYEATLKALITQFKFEHARAAHKPLAVFLAGALPHFANDWIVVAIPTIPAHIRQRSYDHAALLAGEVARIKGLRRANILARQHDTRQVGATRQQRAESARNAFWVRKDVAGKKLLVIDDVCTTGATLQSAAAALKAAGAAEVWGAVAAWQPPK